MEKNDPIDGRYFRSFCNVEFLEAGAGWSRQLDRNENICSIHGTAFISIKSVQLNSICWSNSNVPTPMGFTVFVCFTNPTSNLKEMLFQKQPTFSQISTLQVRVAYKIEQKKTMLSFAHK